MGDDVPLLVVLNRFDADDDLHRRNAAWLAERDGFVVTTLVAGVGEWAIALAPPFCGFCGKPRTVCDRACVLPLDPDHFCVKCGRRLVVTVTPTSHSARCKVHGAL